MNNEQQLPEELKQGATKIAQTNLLRQAAKNIQVQAEPVPEAPRPSDEDLLSQDFEPLVHQVIDALGLEVKEEEVDYVVDANKMHGEFSFPYRGKLIVGAFHLAAANEEKRMAIAFSICLSQNYYSPYYQALTDALTYMMMVGKDDRNTPLELFARDAIWKLLKQNQKGNVLEAFVDTFHIRQNIEELNALKNAATNPPKPRKRR